MVDLGRAITDEINADPAEVERLRASRRSAYEGRLIASRLWAEDWDSPEDAVYDEGPGRTA